MDSANGIYDNHSPKTTWRASNTENSNDISNKEIVHFIRKPSDYASPHANNNKNESEKKPPILPNRTSVVINLDKNRIRVGRRSRLLPRPLSLPSSFNLLKNMKQNQDDPVVRETSLDISLIKKLEDEIYQRKEDVLRQNENVINKRLCDNDKCTNCSKVHRFVPNQIVETKTFVDDTSAFTDPNSKPVLVVDSSRLQPLLMKRDKDAKKDVEAKCVTGAKSILIVDNSQYYPVLMTYEIKDRTEKTTNQHHKNQPTKLSILSSGNAKKETQPSKQQRHFTNLFESCFCKSNPPSPESSPQTTTNYPSSTRSTTSTSSSTSSSFCSNVTTDDKNVSASKSSKFKRFLIHRRSLNLPTRSHQPPKTDDVETDSKKKDKKKSIAVDTPNMTTTAKCVLPDFPRLDDVQFTNFECKLKNNKLKWLLSGCNGRTSNTTKLNLAKKRWLSCDDVSDAEKCNNYLSIYCAAFKRANWSCDDVHDIRNNNRLMSTTATAQNKQSDGRLNDDGRNEDINKMTTPADCNGNNLVRRVRRRSSFRNKRHSVGSTDVVKTWVYRKR